jgi:ribosomal protein S3
VLALEFALAVLQLLEPRAPFRKAAQASIQRALELLAFGFQRVEVGFRLRLQSRLQRGKVFLRSL